MRLLSYHHQGAIRTAAIAGQYAIDVALLEHAVGGGNVSDDALIDRLSAVLPEPVSLNELIAGSPERLNELRRSLERVAGSRTSDVVALLDLPSIRFAIPTPGSGKFLCVGRNYLEHINESGRDVPGDPVIFTRYEDSLVAHRQALIRPSNSTEFDWEGELAVIIGRRSRHLRVEDALGAVAGYAVFNDGSVRDYQHKTVQWTAGKNFPRSGSYGPYFVTADEIPDPQALDLETSVNNETVQKANTAQMIFPVAKIISFISEWTELRPGDVIATGTPAGIGAARNPKWFLSAGDVVTVTIEHVGQLVNSVEDE